MQSPRLSHFLVLEKVDAHGFRRDFIVAYRLEGSAVGRIDEQDDCPNADKNDGAGKRVQIVHDL